MRRRSRSHADIARSNEAKTPVVHFLRFEHDPTMIPDWHGGTSTTLSRSLPTSPVTLTPSPKQRLVLAKDVR